MDDSSLQWSSCGTGVTDDPAKTLDELFERLVTRHEEAHPAVRREDKDVWKPFEKEFRARHLLVKMQEKLMVHGELRHRFENSWQPANGYLRLFQPLSFDLIEPSDIVQKAVDWGGLVRQLRKTDAEFEINLLLGRPVDRSKWAAFEQAQSVLQEDVQGRKRLVLEERASEFARDVETEIEATAA